MVVLTTTELHGFDLELPWRRMVVEVRSDSLELVGVSDAMAAAEHTGGSRRGHG